METGREEIPFTPAGGRPRKVRPTSDASAASEAKARLCLLLWPFMRPTLRPTWYRLRPTLGYRLRPTWYRLWPCPTDGRAAPRRAGTCDMRASTSCQPMAGGWHVFPGEML
jgi:hypothetical protein